MEAAPRDPQLWRMAKARAKFKTHLFTYLAVNGLLWTIWFLTDFSAGHRYGSNIPWPVWSTVFWGIGVFMNGVGVYGGLGKSQLSEREYERLVRERQGQ
ncbi:2TM domain-containing protein [Hymenobacter metallicola]|uniref:2TM domain-containing protein n=1 Tax=Hymenobacter metallicola TaxID=2563114 RepID=A0A4Z0Q2N4_9BACT|nr:2TM domain-containing protein [Hymenobacter metallicola]TGE23393.1 2TM domain-containing protein [Hymenobacter metallicola]